MFSLAKFKKRQSAGNILLELQLSCHGIENKIETIDNFVTKIRTYSSIIQKYDQMQSNCSIEKNDMFYRTYCTTRQS